MFHSHYLMLLYLTVHPTITAQINNYVKFATTACLILQRIHICTLWGLTPETNGADCTVSSPEHENTLKHTGAWPLQLYETTVLWDPVPFTLNKP